MFIKLQTTFRNMPIRYKLLFNYSFVYMLSITVGCLIIYFLVRDTVEKNIESELQNSTNTILNLVRTSASVSIKNHLRATAEQNQKITEYFYRQFQNGKMMEQAAKEEAAAAMLSRSIGSSGYIYCLNSKGIVTVHPKKEVLYTDVSHREFAQQQITNKNDGYYEYDWKNPDDKSPQPKANYWTYFEPWDWIITASAYRKEFTELVNVDDFRESVLSLKFGKTGYSYITDAQGNTIIHPKNQGINILRNSDNPNRFFTDMLKQKSGKAIYSWRNPGEDDLRKKLVIFNYIPEYQWIVASSSYLEEFYAPLISVRNIIIITICVSLLAAFPITFRLSSSITNPLQELMNGFATGVAGDFSVRVQHIRQSQDEVGRLTEYFNTFMKKLELYATNLRQEIRERVAVEEALRESQGRYESVIEAIPDPVIVYDMEGKVTYMNPAFTEVFGWTSEESLGKNMNHFVPKANWPETHKMIEEANAGKKLSAIETRRFNKNGNLVEVSNSGSVFKDKSGNPVGSVIILRDITKSKRLEREVMEIGDRERQKIGQDLHDDLGPHLIGVEGLAKALQTRLEEKLSSESTAAEKITNYITEAINKTRNLARGLCPVHLVAHGLGSSLMELASNTESAFGISCHFNSSNPVYIRNNTVATHLYYIAQEALSNAVKHGKAETVLMYLSYDDGNVSLKIIDDGQGIKDEPETKGMGLNIMRFRSNMIGAVFDIKPHIDGGTIVHVCLKNHVVI